MRILHAPRNIAGQASLMADAQRRLGHEAEVWSSGESRFGFDADRVVPFGDAEAIDEVWRALGEAVERFDVFHFHYGRSLFPGRARIPPLWDLPLLRALGKKVVVSFWGSDCRSGRVQREVNPYAELLPSEVVGDRDDRLAKSIHIWRTYANTMLVHSPELLSYVPDATAVGRIFDLSEWPVGDPPDRETPVVLHMPSRRELKGTDLVLAGVEWLRRDGVALDFRLVENVQHDEAKKLLCEADIVVDQLIAGDHGIVSVEAMASGRVAVAYLLPVVRAEYPDLPIHDANPDDFSERMRLLVEDRELRRRLGAAGRPFVERHFDAAEVGAQLIEIYSSEGAAPHPDGFPDWAALGGERQIERLQERVAKLLADRARLRGRLDLESRQGGAGESSLWRRLRRHLG
jgi:hypothetical protein